MAPAGSMSALGHARHQTTRAPKTAGVADRRIHWYFIKYQGILWSLTQAVFGALVIWCCAWPKALIEPAGAIAESRRAIHQFMVNNQLNSNTCVIFLSYARVEPVWSPVASARLDPVHNNAPRHGHNIIQPVHFKTMTVTYTEMSLEIWPECGGTMVNTIPSLGTGSVNAHTRSMHPPATTGVRHEKTNLFLSTPVTRSCCTLFSVGVSWIIAKCLYNESVQVFRFLLGCLTNSCVLELHSWACQPKWTMNSPMLHVVVPIWPANIKETPFSALI